MTETPSGTGSVRRTNRWRGLAGVALLLGGIGLFARQSALLVVCAFGIGLDAYARFVSPPPATVAISRTVSNRNSAPGEEVRVTVHLTNTGQRTIPQLIFTDGVPESATIQDGSPHVGTALGPGATATVTYSITVRPGTHEFQPATVVTRDVIGVVERHRTITDSAADTVVGQPGNDALEADLMPKHARYTGRCPTDAAGNGMAFRSVREYRRGDPMTRIDWTRKARKRELKTVEFQVERQATIGIVVDGRRAAARSPTATAPTARQRAVEAATSLYATLTERGHRVGVARVGPDASWQPPGRGETHKRQVQTHLAVPDKKAATDDPMDQQWGEWLAERIPAHAIVIMLSPVCDDDIVDTIERMEVGKYQIRIVSPDPTATETAGQQLAKIERLRRLRELRRARMPVVDWQPDVRLGTALRSAW